MNSTPKGLDTMKTEQQAIEEMQKAIQERLAGEAKAFLEKLPEPVQQRVETLKGLQTEHDKLEEEYKKERQALEAKYKKLYDPLYQQRAGIVAGNAADAEDVRGIPNFWLTALSNMPAISPTITQKDEEVLAYLVDITSYPLDEQKGFRLEFKFVDNPFFTNSVLSKTYCMVDDEDPILEKIEGTDIEWQTGKNVTVKIMKKKPKKPGQKVLTKTEPCESFFTFFSPPQLPESEDDIDPEDAEELQQEMESDYDIGTMIRDKIIPNAVLWFTGEAVDFEDYYDDDDEDDDDDDDEDDDEDDDDEEDEDTPPHKSKGAATKGGGVVAGGGGGAADGEQPPECKQQ